VLEKFDFPFQPSISASSIRELAALGLVDGKENIVRVARLGTCKTHPLACVLDDGVGAPEAELPALFTPFHRGSNVAYRIGGSCIGLIRVKQIVEEHGGSIEVVSKAGEGNCVRVSLPPD
jgi:signal transduction histidine kinase